MLVPLTPFGILNAIGRLQESPKQSFEIFYYELVLWLNGLGARRTPFSQDEISCTK